MRKKAARLDRARIKARYCESRPGATWPPTAHHRNRAAHACRAVSNRTDWMFSSEGNRTDPGSLGGRGGDDPGPARFTVQRYLGPIGGRGGGTAPRPLYSVMPREPSPALLHIPCCVAHCFQLRSTTVPYAAGSGPPLTERGIKSYLIVITRKHFFGGATHAENEYLL